MKSQTVHLTGATNQIRDRVLKMSKRTRKQIGIGLAVFTIAILVALQFKPDMMVIATEPAAGESVKSADEALPTPSRPLLKGKDNYQVTTVVSETPQANGVNGAPKRLKTDLGFEISPLCFEQLFGVDGPKGPIDVTTCEQISGYKNIQTGIEEGRYRSLYEFPSEPDMPAEKGFSSYEVLGDTAGGTAVQTYNETGGTGRFSSIVLVKLTGNILSLVDQIAGGDRCNNGLTEAKVEDGKLIYSASITPGDFPMLAWNEDKGLKPYEDLEASAMSCFGTVTFTDGKISEVSLNPDATKEEGDWTSQYKYQKCFNGKFKEALAAGQKDMNLDQFKAFMDGFLANCKKN